MPLPDEDMSVYQREPSSGKIPRRLDTPNDCFWRKAVGLCVSPNLPHNYHLRPRVQASVFAAKKTPDGF